MHKEICKNCWNNYPQSRCGWDKLREAQWEKKGFVMCTRKLHNAMCTRYIDLSLGVPPEQCIYKLEHMVVGQQ